MGDGLGMQADKPSKAKALSHAWPENLNQVIRFRA
jgi:hypothetical protein